MARDFTDHAVNKIVWNQFEKQKSRGTEGFGVFDGKHIFKTPKLKKMRGWIKNVNHKSDFIMFHHRWPTSTINVKRAAHPFSTGDFFGDTRYVLVHNGTITNPKQAQTAHEKLGIKYTSVLDNGTFNDSEALLWDFALTMEGKQEEMKVWGGIAFVCAKLEKGEITHLYFGRNFGRPLNLYREKDGIMLSSEGDGKEIDTHTLYTYNYKLNRLTNKKFKVPSFDPAVEYRSSGHSHTPYSTYTGSNLGETSPRSWNYSDETGWYYDDNGDVVFNEWEEDEEQWETLPLNKENENEMDLIKEEIIQDAFLDAIPASIDLDKRASALYNNYLKSADGFYEDCYWDMEEDYILFETQKRSNKRDLILGLLEKALFLNNSSPSNVDENSRDPNFTPQVQAQLALVGSNK